MGFHKGEASNITCITPAVSLRDGAGLQPECMQNLFLEQNIGGRSY